MFADGHDQLACEVLFRHGTDQAWSRSRMQRMGNDRWRGEFSTQRLGRSEYTVEGWIDRFATWRSDLAKRIEAGQDVRVECVAGAILIEETASLAPAEDAARLLSWAQAIREEEDPALQVTIAMQEEMANVAGRYPNRQFATRYGKVLGVVVDRERAGYSTWYELFPRSCSPEPGRHGTLGTAKRGCPTSPRWASMCFTSRRFIPSDTRSARARTTRSPLQPDDVGSPWAIGSEEGGHTSVHPQLGTLDDFDRLIAKAKDHGIEIALDIAFQCTPDHPYVRQHPEWFRKRPDGTIQYAENPPKKYRGYLSPRFRDGRSGKSCGRNCGECSYFGLSMACVFSASTIRTRKRCRSGNG